VARALPDVAPRVLSVPKGVLLGTEPFDLRHGSRDLFVVLPAGVRAVKQPRWPIRPLEALRREGLAVRYLVLGPELEAEEARALARDFEARPWCSRLEVPPDAMPAALAASDLVVNCSRVEGFANALAEALAEGCCVLAADLPGNRAALGPSGVIFDGEDDFRAKARALLLDPEERRRLGEAARHDAARRFDPEREIDALLGAYGLLRADGSR
jgi:glycosyltransferase involved in cell wall biosynthesis